MAATLDDHVDGLDSAWRTFDVRLEKISRCVCVLTHDSLDGLSRRPTHENGKAGDI